MIRAACHCEAVRLEFAEPPKWVLDCNCTLCRRYGGLWCYFDGPDAMKLLTGPSPDATETYLWNGRGLAFHRCKTCGCVTHMMVEEVPPTIYGVNARLMAGLDPAKVRIRRKNNSHSGYFWTRPDEPIEASRHPAMAPPSPMDWR